MPPKQPSLFTQALEIYWQNAVTLSLIILAPLITHIFLWEISPFKQQGFQPLALVMVTTLLMLQSWGVISALQRWQDRREGNPVLPGFSHHFNQIITTGWTIILATFLIFGAGLLFIIPGIYLLVKFSLAIFFPICQNTSGFSALYLSKTYVEGKEMEIIKNLAVAGGIFVSFLLIPFTVSNFFGTPFFNNVLWGISLLLAGPIILSYFFLIYQKLKLDNSQLPSPSFSGKLSLFLWPLSGFIIIPLAVFTILNAQMPWTKQAVSYDQQRLRDQQLIKEALGAYYLNIRSYPLTLDTLQPHYLPKVPFDPKFQVPYRYTSTNDGQNYQLCISMKGEENCTVQP